jgi:hypothetical protein
MRVLLAGEQAAPPFGGAARSTDGEGISRQAGSSRAGLDALTPPPPLRAPEMERAERRAILGATHCLVPRRLYLLGDHASVANPDPAQPQMSVDQDPVQLPAIVAGVVNIRIGIVPEGECRKEPEAIMIAVAVAIPAPVKVVAMITVMIVHLSHPHVSHVVVHEPARGGIRPRRHRADPPRAGTRAAAAPTDGMHGGAAATTSNPAAATPTTSGTHGGTTTTTSSSATTPTHMTCRRGADAENDAGHKSDDCHPEHESPPENRECPVLHCSKVQTFAQLHSRHHISAPQFLTCRACWLRLEIAQNCRAWCRLFSMQSSVSREPRRSPPALAPRDPNSAPEPPRSRQPRQCASWHSNGSLPVRRLWVRLAVGTP